MIFRRKWARTLALVQALCFLASLPIFPALALAQNNKPNILVIMVTISAGLISVPTTTDAGREWSCGRFRSAAVALGLVNKLILVVVISHKGGRTM